MTLRAAFFCTVSAFIFHVSVSAAPAPDARAEAALARLEAAEKGVQTLRFSFTQTTLIKVTAEEQVLKGKAAFKRPSRFRVEHLSPRRLTAVADGKTLWVYNPERNQVMTDLWENWAKSAGFPQGLTPFQEGAGDLRRKYDVSLDSASARGDVLRLVPKEPGAWPYTLRVTVDAATGFPTRTELESQTLKTVTDVQGLEMNPPLADDSFIFKIPAGADVFGPPAPEGTPKK